MGIELEAFSGRELSASESGSPLPKSRAERGTSEPLRMPGKLEARVGIEPTYKGFADLRKFSILLARLAFCSVLAADFVSYLGLNVPKLFPNFWPLFRAAVRVSGAPGNSGG